MKSDPKFARKIAAKAIKIVILTMEANDEYPAKNFKEIMEIAKIYAKK